MGEIDSDTKLSVIMAYLESIQLEIDEVRRILGDKPPDIEQIQKDFTRARNA